MLQQKENLNTQENQNLILTINELREENEALNSKMTDLNS